MIYVYLTTWHMGGENGNEVENPLSEHLATFPAAASKEEAITVNYYYPKHDKVIRGPRGSIIMAVVDVPLGVDHFSSIPGVWLVPRFKLDRKLSTIPKNVKNAFINKIDDLGIPAKTWTDLVTMGDLIDKILTHFNADYSGLVARFASRSGDFG